MRRPCAGVSGPGRSLAVALVAVVVLVSAACGRAADETSSADVIAGTTTSAAASPPAAAALTTSVDAAPAGADLAPLRVGVALVDFERLVDLGLLPAGWGDQEQIWRLVADGIDRRGGVGGHPLQLVFSRYLPVGEIEARETCLRLVDDERVHAVVGAFVGPASGANDCFLERDDLIVVGGTPPEEQVRAARAAFVGDAILPSRAVPALFDLLEREGRLDGQTVAIVASASHRSRVEGIVVPELRARGIDPLVHIDDVSDTDLVAEEAFWDVTAERLRVEGVTAVVLDGDVSVALAGIARNELEVQRWVIEADLLANLAAFVAPADASGAVALGSLTPDEEWDDPETRVCVDDVAAAGVELVRPSLVAPGTEDRAAAVRTACTWLGLLDAVGDRAGPDLDAGSFRRAAETAGELELAGMRYASLGVDKPDADDGARLVVFDPTVGDRGGLRPLTELVDLTP